MTVDPWHGSRFLLVGLVALDPLFKKYFALVVLGLVALAAYFQATGATQLFGAALVGDEDALAGATGPFGSAGPPPTKKAAKSADSILKRNPFDSITGPLVGAQSLDQADLPQQRDALGLADPLGAPACPDVRVNIVTESTDPLWSFAALQGPGEPKPVLRRVGDRIGSREVTYIGFNPREGSPAVWLMDGLKLCQAMVFGEQPKPQASASPPGGKPPKKARRRRGAPPLPPEMAAKIQRVSETEYHVDRTVLDKILENQAQLMRSARIVPEQKDGKTVGIRLFGIRPDTLLGHLGFQNGDRLEAINGFPMASPEKALEAYARLRTADNLNVQVNRRGKPLTIDFRIK